MAHIPGHICCCPLQGLYDALLDHQFQVMVFYTLNFMAPLFKEDLCLPGIASPPEVFILGVPKWRPDVKVLIKHPTSSLGWTGAGGAGSDPWGTHPLSGCEWACGWNGCLWVQGEPTLPLLERWPPGHPHLDFHSLVGFPKVLVEDFWAVQPVHVVQPPDGGSPWAGTVPHPLGPQGLIGGIVEFLNFVGGYQWANGLPLPLLRVGVGSPKVPYPPLSFRPYLHFGMGRSPDGNGFVMANCGLNGSTCSMLHIAHQVKQNYQFHCWITEHTQGVSVSQSHIYFHNVFLWHRGDIKGSAIFFC